jgi:hypothetical protein
MQRKLPLLVASAMVWVAVASLAGSGPAWAACDPGTKLDKTTVEDARQILLKAGYTNMHHLRKGCDNTWHGDASIHGTQIDVAILPGGRIVEESD